MNRTITTGLAVTVTLLLGGCGGSDAPDKTQKTPTSCASQGPNDETVKEMLKRCSPESLIPEPDPNQAADLVRKLDAIAPGLAGEPVDTIDNARNTCSSILGGSNNLVQATKARFTGDGVDTMSDDQAEKIIGVVKDAPWCTT